MCNNIKNKDKTKPAGNSEDHCVGVPDGMPVWPLLLGASPVNEDGAACTALFSVKTGGFSQSHAFNQNPCFEVFRYTACQVHDTQQCCSCNLSRIVIKVVVRD